MGYDPSFLQHHVGHHSSQGSQRRRGSIVEAWDVIAKERLHLEDAANPEVIGDPIAELQNTFHEATSLRVRDVYSEVYGSGKASCCFYLSVQCSIAMRLL